jgi:predicted Zn-dependent peptidase
MLTYAGVDHKNAEQTIAAALAEYKSIAAAPPTEAELKRVKDYIHGTTLIGLEQSNAVASFIGSEEMLTGRPVTADEVFAKLDAVTAGDIAEAAREMFRPERLNLAMIGPFRDGTPFENIIKNW